MKILSASFDSVANEQTVGRWGSDRSAMYVISIGLACAWLIPYHTFPYWVFYSEYVAISAIVIATLMVLSNQRASIVAVPKTVVLPLATAALVLVHAITGHMAAPWDGAIGIAYLLAATAAMVLPFNLFRADAIVARNRAWNALAIACVAAGTVSALITFFQYLGVDNLLGDWSAFYSGDANGLNRPYANLGQPNQLALLLCWSLAALWWLHQSRKLGNGLALLISGLLLASLVVTQSKIAWMIVPVIAGASVLGHRVAGVRRISPTVVVVLALYFIAMIVLLPNFGEIIGTHTQSLTDRMQTNAVRTVMILQGLYIGLQHPLIGAGWGSFGEAQVTVALQFGDTQYAMHAHNLVANLAAETGWIFTLGFCAATGWWFYTRFVRLLLTPERLLALMILSAVGLHSMVEFPLWYAYILVPVGLVIGLVESSATDTVTNRAWSFPRKLFMGIALASGLCLAAAAADYRNLVQSFRAFGFELVGLKYAEGSVERPRWTALPHYYDYLDFAQVRPTVAMTPEEIEKAEHVATRFAYAPVLMRLATIYALNGRPDDAVAIVATMRKLYPQRYTETYLAWKTLAEEFPQVLAPVYGRLTPPSSKSEEVR